MAGSKYDIALDAINTMFSDTSVSAETTKENLRGLIDEIDVMLDSLD